MLSTRNELRLSSNIYITCFGNLFEISQRSKITIVETILNGFNSLLMVHIPQFRIRAYRRSSIGSDLGYFGYSIHTVTTI